MRLTRNWCTFEVFVFNTNLAGITVHRNVLKSFSKKLSCSQWELNAQHQPLLYSKSNSANLSFLTSLRSIVRPLYKVMPFESRNNSSLVNQVQKVKWSMKQSSILRMDFQVKHVYFSRKHSIVSRAASILIERSDLSGHRALVCLLGRMCVA